MHASRRSRLWLPIFVATYSVFVGVAGVLAAAPFLSRLRMLLPWLVLSSLAATIVVVARRRESLRAIVGVVSAFVVALASATTAEMIHADRRAAVLLGDARRIEPVSRHMLFGYRDLDEAKALLERFDFAGVFVTARNAAGKDEAALAAEIASLQDIQRRHGRLPLLVAADQEGGTVARLSGPLPWRASLAAYGDDPITIAEHEARALGASTAADLLSVGVNVNFAPVVDLRIGDPSLLDTHSRIAERAIAADPDKVARVAHAYTAAMTNAGVLPVAKHFPGLGRLRADTHVTDATLTAEVATLAASDWVPFAALSGTGAGVMVGHAILREVDPHRPASTSSRVVEGVLRGELGHEGLVFTDDLCMAPTYRRGVSESARSALVAGVDVLLVTYDMDVVYEILVSLAGIEVPNDERVLAARRGLEITARLRVGTAHDSVDRSAGSRRVASSAPRHGR